MRYIFLLAGLSLGFPAFLSPQEGRTEAPLEAPAPGEKPARQAEVPAPGETPAQDAEIPVPGEKPVQKTEAPQEKTPEEQRLDTLRYGTETEIAALIQAMKNEGGSYLDEEFIVLVQNSRNRTILAGIFSFFGDRGREGLEDRALRALDEWDEEANETVLAAIDYLGKVKAPAAILPLEKLLDGEERRFMAAAFKALGLAAGNAGDEAHEAADFLMDFYTNRDPSDEYRREIVLALGETGSPRGVSFLSALAEDNDARAVLRMAALESLAKIGDPQGLGAVLNAASSADPNIRSTAIGALGPFSDPAADRVILEGFRDSYYRSRIAAAQAAGKRGLNEAAPYLRYRAERDEVPAVKDAAIQALGAVGTGEAMAVLESLFVERKNSDRVRILSAEMLIRHNGDQYAQKAIAELDEAKTKNQTALYNGLLRVLGGAKTPGVEELARRFFASGAVVEKSYALDMTANNEFHGLADEVKKLAEDKNGALARKARETLAKLGLDSP
jgi:HEAT repeat protein